MTDEILTDAEKLAADAKAQAEAVATEAKAKADAQIETSNKEIAANITTAKHRVHRLGHDLEDVAHWLVATTRGAVKDVGEAIRWIGKKL